MGSKKGCIFAAELNEKDGVLAQVARAFDWQSKGHRFDSDILHTKMRPKRPHLSLIRL